MLWTIYLLLLLWAVGFLFGCKPKSKPLINNENNDHVFNSHHCHDFDGNTMDYNPSTGMPMTRCGAIRCGVDVTGKAYGEI
jgi:hypothetical protein